MLKISVLTTLFALVASISNAQQLNVIQVKGNRAIVEIQTGEKLKVGESYAVGKVDGEISLDPVASGKGTRNYLIGIQDLQLVNTKTDERLANSEFSLGGTFKFGWNKKQYEYGPLGYFKYLKNSNNTGTTLAQTTWGIGGFGTYNFQPNIIGTELIFSGDVDFLYKSTSSEALTVKTSTTAMEFTVGPYAKWYVLSDDHCIRGGLVFAWSKSDGSNSDAITTTGIKAVVGISTYF